MLQKKLGGMFCKRRREPGKSIQLFMNVTKVILTRCQIFHFKGTKFKFWTRPRWGAHSAPSDLAGFGEKEKGRERERGRADGEQKQTRGNGREGGDVLEEGEFAA